MRFGNQRHQGGQPARQSYAVAGHGPRLVGDNVAAISNKQPMLDRLKIMKRTRFTSHSRFERKDGASVFMIAMLSFYVFCLSLYPVVFEASLNGNNRTAFVFVGIMSAVFIMIISVLQSSKNYLVKAFHMHECGKKLNRLHRLLERQSPASAGDLHSIEEHYFKVIHECPYNHGEIDYQLARLKEGRAPQPWHRRALIYAWYLADVYGFAAFMLGVPIILLWLFT